MSVMVWSLFLFLIISSGTIHARGYRCPTTDQIRPCSCEVFGEGLAITCMSARKIQVQKALANVAETKQSIELTLVDVPLVSISSAFLSGLHFDSLSVTTCNLSTIEENAFAGAADELKSLFLSDNSFESVPTEGLKILSSLTALDLIGNNIEVLRAKSFEGLHSLSALSLQYNKIKIIDDSSFVGVESSLKTLNLDDNELTVIPAKALSNLGSLSKLGLRKNKIVALKPDNFVSTILGKSLKALYLSGNSIRHLPARAFTSLEELCILDLSTNGIESLHLSAFQMIEDNLIDLKLDRNRLVEVPAASLKNLKRLSTVDFSDNNIGKVRKDDFLSYGKSLHHLYLNNNSLTFVESAALAPLESLQILRMESNQLTSVPSETYAPVLDTLQEFYIHDNPFHCDCEMIWLQDWMKSGGSKVIQFENMIRCALPEEYVNTPLAEMSENRLVCRKQEPTFNENDEVEISLNLHSFTIGDALKLCLGSFALAIAIYFAIILWLTVGQLHHLGT